MTKTTGTLARCENLNVLVISRNVINHPILPARLRYFLSRPITSSPTPSNTKAVGKALHQSLPLHDNTAIIDKYENKKKAGSTMSQSEFADRVLVNWNCATFLFSARSPASRNLRRNSLQQYQAKNLVGFSELQRCHCWNKLFGVDSAPQCQEFTLDWQSSSWVWEANAVNDKQKAPWWREDYV